MNIGVVGLGLIGGSLAKAIRENTEHTVWGYDIAEPVIYRAKLIEAIHEPLTEENLPECDILILAIYPRDTLEFMEKNAPKLKKGSIVVDCCGVKMAVCHPCWVLAERYGFTFIGGHPMEGLAKIGFENSTGTLFRNAGMIICPGKDLDIETMKRLKDVFDAIGFTHYEVATPEKHDRLISYTSQLAHVLSNAYVKLPKAQEHKGFSAGSFRDLTRVSYLNEVMWAELFMLNRANLAEDVEALIGELQKYADALRAGDETQLRELLRIGKECKIAVDQAEYAQ